MKITFNSGKFNLKNKYLFTEAELTKKLQEFKATIDDPTYGFFHVSDQLDLLNKTEEVYENFKDRTHFVHVGIGGSALGPEMLIKALSNNKKASFSFINNIDVDTLKDQLDLITDINKCVFYFVSKSGGTAETMASLAVISNFLAAKGVEKNQLKNYFIFATDPEKSDLLKLGKELEVTCLPVPSNVGGRFSVLTPVGFLPALFAKIDIKELLQGANEIKKDLLNNDVNNNQLLLTAAQLFALKELGVNQTVFMPYSSKLKEFSSWFVQLWAESLGKKKSKSEQENIFTGLTPIASYGATDQHSQIQLFMEGPFDKVCMMLEVEKFENTLSLKNSFNIDALKKLSPFTMEELMAAEFHGTLKALETEDRPYFHIAIERNSPKHIGELIIFLESLTTIMGSYLNIDPFDQPGVEAGKHYASKWLAGHIK